jgi:hypothetical protein
VHAVLAAAFGHGLHLGEIAQILGWTIDRVRVAAVRIRPGGGTRLHHDDDTIALELTPGMLDHPSRQRLHKVLHVYGIGPDVNVLHMVFESSACTATDHGGSTRTRT